MSSSASPLCEASFDTYMSLEKRFQKQRYDDQLKAAYIKVSSYILSHEQINLVKNQDISIVQELLKKYQRQNPFTPLGEQTAQDCLLVLQRYLDYMHWLKKNNPLLVC